ncbi:YccS family putative transporter [Gaoshiqia sp. Z1-71]|uniref:YccS family putative transporter n=1 Tax=Gaoshiqia hydrogeniformans TaxID=3290090 RepID=UPI003BF7FFCD
MGKQQHHSGRPAILSLLERQAWYEPARRAFWSNPDLLMAAKTTVVMAFLSIPFVLAGLPLLSVTLALGALAGALSETDDHPRGRIKSLGLKVISFGISSLSVELLRLYPVLLGLGLAASTIVFLLLGGLSERYRGVTFGALLVGIYTMLGAEISPAWYWQPVLLTSGALVYGIFSLALLYYRPWRLLEEQLARGFFALSKYLDEKANLFPSNEKLQGEVRNRLALLNVQLVTALDRCKEVLNSYGDAVKDEAQIRPYLEHFMLLQSLHERATSSHERYDHLSRDAANREIMEGIGQLLHQLARASRNFAYSLLIRIPYHHPAALDWTVKALNDQLEKYRPDQGNPLILLVRNLSRSNSLLRNLNDDHRSGLIPRLEKDSRSLKQRLNDQLRFSHPRMRHAIRLSLCLLAGFCISEGFALEKGEWIILTSLFVCQPSYSETRRKLFQRVLGTLSGVFGGVLVVQLLPTVAGQVLLMLLAAFAFFVWLRRNYAVSVVFITIFVLCAFNLISSQGVAVMFPRMFDTMIGSALAILTVRLLWPDWQHKRMPGLLNEAMTHNAAYFQAILNEYRQANAGDDLGYRIARRQAHRADNALALAWQDMQVEPRKRRQFREQAFTLTYLNHALLSYLSALGAHRDPVETSADDLFDLASQILAVLQETSRLNPENTGEKHLRLNDTIARLRSLMAEPGPPAARQQYTLLYHIAEVTLKMIDRSRIFRPGRVQPGD